MSSVQIEQKSHEIPEQCEEVQSEIRGRGSKAVGGAFATAASRTVGGTATTGRTPSWAGRAADHPGSDRRGSDPARGTALPAGPGVELRALGAATGLCRVCRAESGGGTSPSAHAERPGSFPGQLRAAATRRAAAASGARRDRRGADIAELSPGSPERARWLRDREVQRESGICGCQRGATENALREKTK